MKSTRLVIRWDRVAVGVVVGLVSVAVAWSWLDALAEELAPSLTSGIASVMVNEDGLIPPCASDGEEHGPCFWDAATMGNGTGRSYYLAADGSVYYADEAGQ